MWCTFVGLTTSSFTVTASSLRAEAN
eukprot:COSAG02_NODE_38228_length_431_cov_1.671687_1_plen_25_part_10